MAIEVNTHDLQDGSQITNPLSSLIDRCLLNIKTMFRTTVPSLSIKLLGPFDKLYYYEIINITGYVSGLGIITREIAAKLEWPI